ncbi:XRE family transcriptional regulator [[Clostridium] innocuum]|nr:XRE family transcriptional regulator [[Clostridium] innocuum]
MDLFDDVQLAQEKLGIDMEALLEAMGISACEGDHTEQENILLHAFLTGFSTLPLIHVENDDIVRAILDVLLHTYQLPLSFLASTFGVSNTDITAFMEGKDLSLQKKYTLSAQLCRLSNLLFPFAEMMKELKQRQPE